MVSNLVGGNAKPKQNSHDAPTKTSFIPFSRLYEGYQLRKGPSGLYFGSYCAIFVLTALVSLILLLPILNRINSLAFHKANEQDVPCGNLCRFELVESIPEGLDFNETLNHRSTFDVWYDFVENAKESIEIASFYWTLRENETYSHPSSKKGEEVYQALLKAGLKRNVTIKVAQNEPSTFQPNPDTEYLQKVGAAQVRSVNFTKLMGAGVLHTKFWVVDRKHVYIGSANMDWRALTQVKELGGAMFDCPCLAEDLGKIFDLYWMLAEEDKLPDKLPEKFSTKYNSELPFKVLLNNKTNLIYFTSSPPSFAPKGRSHDLEGVLKTISNAKKYINIAIMDYFPLTLYTEPEKFWPIIDNEIRRAAIERNVKVRILISQWKNTRKMIYNFMNSLQSLNKLRSKVSVEVRKFKVESTPSQSAIPFARVNHNKYMVTDNGALIGTSNWSADYFIDTAGVSLVTHTSNSSDDTIRKQLLEIFERDWNSKYSSTVY